MLRAQLARVAEIARSYAELLHPGGPAALPFAVEPAVQRALRLLEHRLKPLGSRFSLELDGTHLGMGAEAALVHAATNLLGNACDAIAEVDGAPRLAVRVRPAASAIEVRVSDEGVGVAPAHRHRIFEPRFTTKPPGKGTGLGLSLARAFMARCGGDVYLVDDRDPARLPWAVTEFCISIPAASAKPGASR
jgi:C4-dicarboxylate-specific signal transduction histidine kinase